MAADRITADSRHRIRRLVDEWYEQQIDAAGLKGFREEVLERCRKRAIGQLKIEKELKRLEELNAQREDLERQLQVVEQAIEKKLPFAETRYSRTCARRKDTCEAIKDISDSIYEEERRKHPKYTQLAEIEKKYAQKRAVLESCATYTALEQANLLEVE